MPTHVVKNPKGGWDIVEDSTGRKVAHSRTKRNAEISSSIRTRAWEQKQRMKGRR